MHTHYLILTLVETSPLVINLLNIVDTSSNVIEATRGVEVAGIVGVFTHLHGRGKFFRLGVSTSIQTFTEVQLGFDFLSGTADTERDHGGSQARAIRIQHDALVLQGLGVDFRDQRGQTGPDSSSVHVADLLGNIGSRSHLLSIASLGQTHQSSLQILVLERVSIRHFLKRLESSKLFIVSVQEEIIVRLQLCVSHVV